MARIEKRIFIAVPPRDVFGYIINPENAPEYNSNVVEAENLSNGSLGLGARARFVFRIGPVEFETLNKVVDFEEDRLFTSEAISGIDFVQSTRLEPHGDGTYVTFSIDYHAPPGVFGVLVRRFVVKDHEVMESLENLKEILEDEAIRRRRSQA